MHAAGWVDDEDDVLDHGSDDNDDDDPVEYGDGDDDDSYGHGVGYNVVFLGGDDLMAIADDD